MVGNKAILSVQSIDMTKYLDVKCCLCIPIKVVCLALGYLMLLMNSFNVLVVVATLCAGWMYRYSVAFDGDSGALWDMKILMRRYTIILIIGFSVLISVAWEVCNVHILIGLHKKRPSSTKLHVVIGILHFLLTLLVYNLCSFNIVNIIMVALEITFTVLFIKTYRSYAALLRYKRRMKIRTIESVLPQIIVNDFVAYPKVMDKQHLVENQRY